MSLNSPIEWTDATWNPVRGCVKISSGCKHCYAETFAERFRGVKGHPYEQGFDLRLVPEKLFEPLVWRSPKLVFVNSMSDLFQDGVPDDYFGTDVLGRFVQETYIVSPTSRMLSQNVPLTTRFLTSTWKYAEGPARVIVPLDFSICWGHNPHGILCPTHPAFGLDLVANPIAREH
jgi:protein gp37